MDKKQVNLTESNLKQIVKEAINGLLNEDGEQGNVANSMNQQQPTQQQTTAFQQNLARYLNAMYKLIENNYKLSQEIYRITQYNNQYLRRIAENTDYRK